MPAAASVARRTGSERWVSHARTQRSPASWTTCTARQASASGVASGRVTNTASAASAASPGVRAKPTLRAAIARVCANGECDAVSRSAWVTSR